jgi:hypothetical protein
LSWSVFCDGPSSASRRSPGSTPSSRSRARPLTAQMMSYSDRALMSRARRAGTAVSGLPRSSCARARSARHRPIRSVRARRCSRERSSPRRR